MARTRCFSIAVNSRQRRRSRLGQMNARHSVAKFDGFMSLGRRTARRILGPLYRPIRRVVRFITWIFPSLGKLLLPAQSNERRLLVVYDTSCQPFNIGDILIVQEGSLV